MKTALDIINRAASKIGVKRAGVPLTDDEIDDFISELNNMMTELEAGGTVLGYTIVSKGSDEITTPDWSFGAIESNLGVRAAPDFDAQISGVLAASASSGLKAILKRTVQIGEVQFPTSLPTGSGNRYFNNERFFSDGYRDDLVTGSGSTLADLENINIEEA